MTQLPAVPARKHPVPASEDDVVQGAFRDHPTVLHAEMPHQPRGAGPSCRATPDRVPDSEQCRGCGQ